MVPALGPSQRWLQVSARLLGDTANKTVVYSATYDKDSAAGWLRFSESLQDPEDPLIVKIDSGSLLVRETPYKATLYAQDKICDSSICTRDFKDAIPGKPSQTSIKVELTVEQSKFRDKNGTECAIGRESYPTCAICPSGKYNFGSAECHQCPGQGTKCDGEFHVQALAGFWQGPPYHKTYWLLNSTACNASSPADCVQCKEGESCRIVDGVNGTVYLERTSNRMVLKQTKYHARVYPCPAGASCLSVFLHLHL